MNVQYARYDAVGGFYSLLSFARGLAMDLGFAGLLQEIEKRFGALVANLTTFCLLILVASWTLEFIISLYASGSRTWQEGDLGGLVRMVIACGILLVATAFIGWSLLKRIFYRQAMKVRKELLDEMPRLVHEAAAEVEPELRQAAREAAAEAIREFSAKGRG